MDYQEKDWSMKQVPEEKGLCSPLRKSLCPKRQVDVYPREEDVDVVETKHHSRSQEIATLARCLPSTYVENVCVEISL